MNIIKSLHASLLQRTYRYVQADYCTFTLLWGFRLGSGNPVLEQELWGAIANVLGQNEVFDAGMPKAHGEALVHGSFFASGGIPVKGGRVSLCLGAIDKELAVFGDRFWVKGLGTALGITGPEPILTMPVSYANAFGGHGDDRNPIGKGSSPITTTEGRIHPLPNIEYPGKLVGSPKDRPDPAGFGRIDMMWEPRKARSGTYDQAYIQTRMPGLPDDIDWTFFNDAPRDQWIEGSFTGDEPYMIRRMHPEHQSLQGKLPGIRGRCFVNQLQGDSLVFKEVPTRLDTVWFFPEEVLGVVMHRATLEVFEDDASDIRQLLLAHEALLDPLRSQEHYRQALEERMDPETGGFRMMNTAPLLPEGCPCPFKELGKDDPGYPLECLSNQNLKAFTDRQVSQAESQLANEKEAARETLAKAGLDSDVSLPDLDFSNRTVSHEEETIHELMEAAIPGAISDPENIDYSRIDLEKLKEIEKYTQQLTKERTQAAEGRLAEEVERLQSIEPQTPEIQHAVAQLQEALQNRQKPPVLPRIHVEEQIAAMQKHNQELQGQALALHSMGLSMEALAGMHLDIEDIEQKVRDALHRAEEGYRLGAHGIPEARSPHEGEEPEIRERLLNAFREGRQTAGGDYAFLDLSGLDLAGIDLNGAYLEYVDFNGTDLSGANLEKAVLVHADLSGADLTEAKLAGANLGRCTLRQTRFIDADLTEAILSQAVIDRAVFHRCLLIDKMDMFLETEFADVDFSGSQMQKSVFINADLSRCRFDGVDLKESHFVQPAMDGTSFQDAVLHSVNFVQAAGEGADFRNADMKNVRFVGGCVLDGATFNGASLNEANLMNCRLQGADFSRAQLWGAILDGSDLSGASFWRATARQAQFNKADLSAGRLDRIDLMEGSLLKARLVHACFREANLYNVNFVNAVLGDTDFTDAELGQTIIEKWRP